MSVDPSKRQSLPVSYDVRNCLHATQVLKESLATSQGYDFLLPQKILVEKRGESGELLASLKIKFLKNRLVTHFEGEKKAVKLSVALGTFCELSKVYDKFHSASKMTEEKLVPTESEFADLLKALESPTSLSLITIDGEEVISVQPLIERVVVRMDNNWSSTSFQTFQNCAHLFKKKFAENICPRLGVDSSFKSLQDTIHNLYIGRCMRGLGHSIALKWFCQVGHEREFSRIANLVNSPGSELYREPIL